MGCICLANLKFNLSEGNRYKITFLPGAFTDFYGAKNDTLNFTASTKLISSYGNLRLVLKNATYPVVVQIVCCACLRASKDPTLAV